MAQRTQRRLIYIYQFIIKDTMKEGYRWTVLWRIQGKVWAQELLCPFGVYHPPGICTVHQTWKLSEPHNLGIFFLRFYHIGMASLQFPTPLPWSNEGGVESSKLLIMFGLSWSFSIQKPSKSCLIRTKDYPFTQEISGDLRVLFKVLLSWLLLMELQGF